MELEETEETVTLFSHCLFEKYEEDLSPLSHHYERIFLLFEQIYPLLKEVVRSRSKSDKIKLKIDQLKVSLFNISIPRCITVRFVEKVATEIDFLGQIVDEISNQEDNTSLKQSISTIMREISSVTLELNSLVTLSFPTLSHVSFLHESVIFPLKRVLFQIANLPNTTALQDQISNEQEEATEADQLLESIREWFNVFLFCNYEIVLIVL